jgi:hypothetical protein
MHKGSVEAISAIKCAPCMGAPYKGFRGPKLYEGKGEIWSSGDVDICRVGVATAGFMSAEWEIHNKASWWIEGYQPRNFRRPGAILVNRLGREFEPAELAVKGPTKKAICRAALMTRINGFEGMA